MLGTPELLETYERHGLKKFLIHIRQEGRYAGAGGHNLLTNVFDERDAHEEAIRETLRLAEVAGHRYRLLDHLGHALKEARKLDSEQVAALEKAVESTEALQLFQSTLPPRMGLARGLNPYTDWTLAQLRERPRGWLLILGQDWYPISDLIPEDWCRYPNPFELKREPFWRNTWAWILPDRTADPDEARKFMMRYRIGVIFHNVIPYLRSPGVSKSDEKWVEQEMRARGEEFAEDLRFLKACLGGPEERIVGICTSSTTKKLLVDAGYCADSLFPWSAHPSRGVPGRTLLPAVLGRLETCARE